MHTPDPSASKDCRRVLLVWFCFLALFVECSTVRAQSGSQSTSPAQAPDSTTQAAPNTATAEISSREEAATFKVNVNLVLVRVVVRDAQGKAIGNLHKEDFQLFDNRKPQVISQFSAEQPGTHAAAIHETREISPGETPAETTTPVAVPERYIAYVFDDVHLNFGDLAQARNAADRHIATLRPTDRAAIFATSGQTELDFTDDRKQLHDALLHLQPRPITGGGPAGCGDVTYFMADLIQNQQDPQALAVATQDVLVCDFNGDTRFLAQAQAVVQGSAMQMLSLGNQESHVALTVLNDVIRRMSAMPGQRSMVLVSPGFLTPQLEFEYMETIDRAVRAQVTIGALDARGLYVPTATDISSPGIANPLTQGQRQLYATQEATADADIMAVLADATGGSFFQNSNDMDEGFRRVASTPEYSYVLGFAPQNLKLDGRFHSLKVTVKAPGKFEVQARRGYFAPKHAADPAQQAKEEIEDALFSQEEVHNLPVDLHTQFFKSSDADAKLTVLAHIDVRRLHLRKADGRNNDELIIVSAVFNRNGNLIHGDQKTLTMHLKDETLQRKMGSGITLKSSFDVQPGSYLVRLVVRDAEEQLVSAANDAVRIP
jgi:VWFA-related protein